MIEEVDQPKQPKTGHQTDVKQFCILLQPLSLKNYAARFSTLLYAEELQMEIDMRQFDIDSVRLCEVFHYVYLT